MCSKQQASTIFRNSDKYVNIDVSLSFLRKVPIIRFTMVVTISERLHLKLQSVSPKTFYHYHPRLNSSYL